MCVKNKNILFISFGLIFFQNAFVLSIAGGSFKWYELLSLLVLFIFFLSVNQITFTRELLCLFILFVVSPIISDIFFFLNDYVSNMQLYQERFPLAASSVRCDPVFSTFYSLILSLGCFASLYFVIRSNALYNRYYRVVRCFLYIGTLVSIYSIYQFIGIGILGLPDIIPFFLDARNYKGGQYRSGGFSIEPGSYVVIQSIVVCYFLFHDVIMQKTIWNLFLIINVLSLIMTLSSSLLVPCLVFTIIFLFYSRNFISKTLAFMSIVILVVLAFMINKFAENNILYYTFVLKVSNFIFGTNNTLDSGAYRAFTNKLGLKIFSSYPFFGCGFGNSFFFMHRYEFSSGIVAWGEQLSATSTPQNNFSKILAEQGVFGIIPFLLFFFFTIKKMFKYAKFDRKVLTYLVITLCVLLFNFSAGLYLTNLFIWLNIALGLNYISHKYYKAGMNL